MGINAPEINHENGKSEFKAKDAMNLNRELVKKSLVRLEYDQDNRDRYGRVLPYVFLENGEMVNAMLVREGLAHVMYKNENLNKYEDLLLTNQRKAISENRGIWGRALKGDEKYYLGNRNSMRFHRPGCHFGRKILKKNRVKFKSLRYAFWEGYSPCKQCNP